AGATFSCWIRVRRDGSVIRNDVSRAESCDAEGHLRLPLSETGTCDGALLFEIPGKMRLIRFGPFSSADGLDLGDIVLTDARTASFRLIDSSGEPLSGGSAAVSAPQGLGRVVSCTSDGIVSLPLPLDGAEVSLAAPRHVQRILTLAPGELRDVRLERA